MTTKVTFSGLHFLLFFACVMFRGHVFSQAACTYSFSSIHQYYASGYQNAMLLDDFTSDGIPDLAYVDSYINKRMVLLKGNAAGSFSMITSFTYTNNLAGIVSADFNGDSNSDVILAAENGNHFLLLLGTGTGTFQPAITFSTWTSPYGLATADFNADGYQDLVFSQNNFAGGFYFMAGTGTGSFSAAVSFTSFPYTTNVIAKDFNSDNKPDIAVSCFGSPGKVVVYLGGGNGLFSAAAVLSPVMMCNALASADFNNDGKPDLAVSQSNMGIGIYLGSGNGTFAAPATPLIPFSQPTDIVIADVNLDNNADLITNSGGRPPLIYLGDGSGGFPGKLAVSSNILFGPILARDINGNGRPDLIIGQLNTTDSVIVFMNNSGTFPPVTIAPAPGVACAGELVSFQANGVAQYTWQPGSITVPAFVTIASASGEYTVTGQDTLMNCSNSAVVSYTVELCTGLHTRGGLPGGLSAYPNPASGTLTVAISEPGEIVICDLLGNTLRSLGVDRGECVLDLGGYPAGVYLLRSVTFSGVREVKLVKTE